jgi:hypothetical protein
VARKETQSEVTASPSPDGDSTDVDTPKGWSPSRVNAFRLGDQNTKALKLDPVEFREAFIVPGTKKLTTEIQNPDVLRANKNIRLMAERSAEAADFAVRHGYQEEAENFYRNESAQAEAIGRRFNDAREARGLEQYLPHNHALAGHLLLGGYSQRTLESARKSLVERSASSGLIVPHIAAKTMQRAIDSQTHPLDVWTRGKLHDFTGSAIHPDSWDGTWRGVQRGLGYCQDRHAFDLKMGRQFGELDRGIGTPSSDTSIRSYRVHQAADELGHSFFDPSGRTSRPTFQALGWAGWRGGVM